MSLPLLGAGGPNTGGGAAFNPASLPPSVWLRAGPTWCFSDAAGTIPCAINDPIRVWKDGVGVITWSQATLGLRPTMVQVSGRFYARFVAASLQCVVSSAGVAVGTGSYAAFMAGKRSNNFGSITGNSVGNTCFEWRSGDSLENSGVAAIGSSTVNPADGTYRTTGVIWDGTAHTTTFYKDGSTNGTGSFSAQNFTRSHDEMGGVTASGHPFLDGDIGEFLSMTTIPNAATIAAIQAYLKANWGTP